MVEGNQGAHNGTRIVRSPAGERDSQQVAGSMPQSEPEARVGGEGSTYQGVGFTGRRLGEPAPTQQPKPDTSVGGQVGAPQTTPPTLYCLSCNSQAQWLPNSQLWCPQCQTAIEVKGEQERHEFNPMAAFALVAFLLVFGFLWVQGTFDNLLVHVGINWETCVQYPFQGNRIECGPQYYGEVDNGWRFWLGL